MKKYVFAQRAGVHIIDLDQTVTLLDRACKFVRGVAEANREVLFVGTKKQAQLTVAEQAVRAGQPYVVERYIGGMLTNFQTIQPRIEYFKALRQSIEETPEEERTGRDWFAKDREYQKLRRNFAGITDMERLPGAVFVIDPKREELLIKEANRLKIPVVALTDTNCDPDVVDYVIPGNDDAIRSINLVSRLIADAIVEGRGEEAAPATDDRPVPPAVEEARLAEERANEGLSEAAEEGGVAEDQPTGLADPAESAGEIAPEEDPTTSYRGSESAEREEGTPSGPEKGAVPPPRGEMTSNQEGEAEAREEGEGTDGPDPDNSGDGSGENEEE
jgi:small subunit ribosomal protein S2